MCAGNVAVIVVAVVVVAGQFYVLYGRWMFLYVCVWHFPGHFECCVPANEF